MRLETETGQRPGIIRSLRLIASFTLLGAVVAGSATAFFDPAMDYRGIGVAVGGGFAALAKLTHLL